MTMRLEDFADDACRFCGGEIDRSRPHAIKRVYCSEECRLGHQYDLERVARIEAKQNRQCARCGAPLALTRRLGSSFCSARCAREDINDVYRLGRQEDKQQLNRSCARCGSLIAPSTRAGAIYCSSSCKRRVLNANWRQRCRDHAAAETKQKEPVRCRWCETMFVPRQMVPPQTLCSLACNMAERRARAAPLPLLSCVICSADYRPKAGCVPRQTCSEPCRQALKARNHRANRAAARRRITCEAIS